MYIICIVTCENEILFSLTMNEFWMMVPTLLENKVKALTWDKEGSSYSWNILLNIYSIVKTSTQPQLNST